MSARDFADLTHADHGTPLRWWRYTDGFAVANFVDRTGRLIIMPAVRNGERCYWHEPLPPLPLYRAAALAARPDAPVLVVESEKAAEAAGALFPDHVCTSWPGGSNAVNKADLGPLQGRDVILWPDNDGAGLTAMARLQTRLQSVARTVAKVDVPRSWPNGWDVAKSPPAGTTPDTLRAMLREAGGGIRPQPRQEGGETNRAASPDAPGARHSSGAPARRAGSWPDPASDPALRAGAPLQGGLARPQWRAPGNDEQACDEDPADPVAVPSSSAPPPPDGAWPEPDLSLLDGHRGHLPAFPVGVLPAFWRDGCGRAAQDAGAPVDYPALALLAVGASLIGTGRRISPVPAWTEPCVLWTALVGGRSSGKTRGQEAVLQLLRVLEDSLGTTSDAARHRYVAALESARQVARWWRQQVHNTAMAGAEPPELPPDAMAPPPLRQLITDEPAVETLADMLRGHRRGILMAPGALAGWLDSTARRVRRHRNRSAWLRWWSAIPPGAAVSVLGTMEPGSAAAAVAGDDGLAARLLFACPEPGPPQALSDRAAPLGPAALAALARLRDLPEPPRVVPLSAGARIRFEDFRQAHAVAAGRLDGAEAAWWSKGPASVLRLAGVLAFLAWAAQPEGTAEPPMLERGTLEAGVDLWQRYLWPHARAVLRSGGIDREPDIKVLRWIRQHAKAQVSREDLRARALCRTCDAGETDVIAARLVAEGWLRPVENVHRPPGRPPVRWVVHPRLCEARDA